MNLTFYDARGGLDGGFESAYLRAVRHVLFGERVLIVQPCILFDTW